jgi:hypothetical protein
MNSSVPRHRVFISYHDGRKNPAEGGDYSFRVIFEQVFGVATEVLVSGAVRDGDIDLSISTETTRQRIRDGYLRNTSVTVVLVGARTWQRKHVDWEIGSSIRDTEFNRRSGLLGILLPSYPGFPDRYNPYTIPPRLHDNIECRFAALHPWTMDHNTMKQWIHEAYLRRTEILPDNSRPQFANNRTGERWAE